MAQRALWKGIIQLGDVRVPVKFYTASQEIRLEFKLLHDADHSPVRQEMVCSVDGVSVPPEHQVKGLEVADGEYVVVTAEELEALEPESARDVKVHMFVKREELDARLFDRPYYLAPDADVSRDSTPYALLLQALAATGCAGIAQWTMRKRSYWGALQAIDGVLVMMTLRGKEDVIPTAAFDIPPATVSERELQLAVYLIDALSGEFQADAYHPVYYPRLREFVARKAAGEAVTVPEATSVTPTPEQELTEVLEASIARMKEGRKRAA